VTFDVYGNNDAMDQTSVPPSFPQVVVSACGADQKPHDLGRGYQWPYASAAAVSDLSVGKLSTCGSGKPDSEGRPRVDTSLALDNRDGRLVIHGDNRPGRVEARNSRTIRLKEAGVLFIANIPTRWVQGDRGASS